MIPRQFPLSSGKNVRPVAIQLVNKNEEPLSNKLIVLTKSKNELELENEYGTRRMVKVEHEKGHWYLQKLAEINGELQAKPRSKRIKLKGDGTVNAIRSHKMIRFIFHADFTKSFEKPNWLITQEDMEKVFLSLDGQMTCSICYQIFTEPITIRCGHTFCSDCWNCWKLQWFSKRCPECRQFNDEEFEAPNFQLLGLIQVTQMMKNVITPLETLPVASEVISTIWEKGESEEDGDEPGAGDELTMVDSCKINHQNGFLRRVGQFFNNYFRWQ